MIDRFTAILVAAQASGRRTVMTPEEFREVLFWLGVIVALGIVAGLIGYWIYRKYKEHNAAPPADATYSLGEMRRLYEDGEISHDEYVAVRTRLLAAAKAMTAQYAATQREVVVTSQPVLPIPDSSAPAASSGAEQPPAIPPASSSPSSSPSLPPAPPAPPPPSPPKDQSPDDEEPII